MAQHKQVLEFGKWDEKEDVPYAAYFENARKGRNGRKLNSDPPQDNAKAEAKAQRGPESLRLKQDLHTSQEDDEPRRSVDSAFSSDTIGLKDLTDSHEGHHGTRHVSSKSEQEAPRGLDVPRPRHERQASRDEGDLRKAIGSPLSHEATSVKGNSESPHNRYGLSPGDTPKRVTRQNVGSDRSVEQSPLHSRSPARVGGKVGGASPAWERRGSSQGIHSLAPSTPGRSRLRSVTRGDDSPEHSPAVPKFGDWVESDPASAEEYTQIFNRVREEKQSGSGKVPSMTTEKSQSNGSKQYGNDDSKGCGCFPWGRRS